MKKNTVFSVLLAAALLATTGGSYAAKSHLKPNDVKLVKRDAKKVAIRVNTPTTAALDVTFSDLNGQVLYTGTIEGNLSNVKQLDLASLPNGEYVVTCDNADFWCSQRLTIEKGEVKIDEASYQEFAQPTLRTYGDNLFEVKPNVTNIADVAVTIVDNQNEVVYQGNLSQGRRFNLNRLPSGDYKFSFVAGSKELDQTVKIK
jgi:hypothetical protein